MTVIAVIIYILITSYRSDRIFFTQSELQASVVLFARDYGIPGMIPGMTVIRPNLLSPNFCSGLYFQYSQIYAKLGSEV